MGKLEVRNKWNSGAAQGSEWISLIKEKKTGRFKGKMADRGSVAGRQVVAGRRKYAIPGLQNVPIDFQEAGNKADAVPGERLRFFR